MPDVRLVLVRHGEGNVNVQGMIGGLHGCTGLTERGREQVRALARRWVSASFRPDVLVSSPVRRARETADLLAASLPGLMVAEDCDLCELHVGAADGLSWSDYDARYGRFHLENEPSRAFGPGAESWAEMMVRVQGCLEELSIRWHDQTVVMVTHAGFIVTSLLWLLAIPNVTGRAYLDPGFTSVTCWIGTALAGTW